jgi:hypothetical protein
LASLYEVSLAHLITELDEQTCHLGLKLSGTLELGSYSFTQIVIVTPYHIPFKIICEQNFANEPK